MKLRGPYTIMQCMMLLLRRHIMCHAPQWSVVAEERCDTDRSHNSILRRQVGERAVQRWGGHSHSRLRWSRKSFFKTLDWSRVCCAMFKGHLNQTSSLYWCHHSSFHTACHSATLWLSVWTTRRLVIWLVEHDVLVHDRIYRQSEGSVYG